MNGKRERLLPLEKAGVYVKLTAIKNLRSKEWVCRKTADLQEVSESCSRAQTGRNRDLNKRDNFLF